MSAYDTVAWPLGAPLGQFSSVTMTTYPANPYQNQGDYTYHNGPVYNDGGYARPLSQNIQDWYQNVSYNPQYLKPQLSMSEALSLHELRVAALTQKAMADKKELTADEKMIVRALKNEKTPSEIAMLIVVSRLTAKTPAVVMEILDDVSKLVTEKLEEKPLSSLGAGKTADGPG